MTFRSLLCATPFALILGWGCSVDEADLGSNEAGHAGISTGDDTSGGGASSATGGSDGEGGTSGDAGGGGTTQCACPYPPILGGDCCTARDGCETDGVGCEELRRSIQALRGWDQGDGSADERQTANDCIGVLSDALVERCAFVPPMCPEPAEDYATFGDHGEESFGECTTEETRRALRCDEPGSYYGPTCCQRRRCQDDGVCPNGRCIFRLVQSPYQNPGAPHAESCELWPQGCACSWIEAGEEGTAYCIDDDEDVARFDCDTQSRNCAELELWRDLIAAALEFEEPSAEAANAYQACAEKISLALDERCTGLED